MALSKKDISQIGDEMVRVLEPVYEDLDSIKKTLDKHTKILNEHTDKIDALTGDVIQLQKEVGVIKDQFVGVNEKLAEDRKDIRVIKKHVGLPLN